MQHIDLMYEAQQFVREKLADGKVIDELAAGQLAKSWVAAASGASRGQQSHSYFTKEKMTKILSLCAFPVLAAGLAVGQQQQPATATDPNNPPAARAEDNRPVDRKPDFGWLGLLGLLGLMGLKRRDREVRVDRTIPVDRERQDLRRAG